MKSITLETVQNAAIKEEDDFNFFCHEKLACFNQCCRNLNMFLYPYDVLRLKNSIHKTSNNFIETHVDIIMRKGNHFPDVLLRMNQKKNMECPFLTSKGCSVYNDRPYSCRIFPIEQGACYEASSKIVKPINFFKPPSFCMGQYENKKWNTKSWTINQKAQTYSDMTIKWSNIKQLFSLNPWKDDINKNQKIKMAFMSVYNIDSFKEFIFNSSFLKRYNIKENLLKKVENNETELLKIGFDWVKLFLWKINSNVIKKK